MDGPFVRNYITCLSIVFPHYKENWLIIIPVGKFLVGAQHVFDVGGGNQSTCRKLNWSRREHANSTQKVPVWEASVLTTGAELYLYKIRLKKNFAGFSP